MNGERRRISRTTYEKISKDPDLKPCMYVDYEARPKRYYINDGKKLIALVRKERTYRMRAVRNSTMLLNGCKRDRDETKEQVRGMARQLKWSEKELDDTEFYLERLEWLQGKFETARRCMQ